ncbi:MAG: S41 family peptidase, partial [Candidatus Dadabacteria bacterium]
KNKVLKWSKKISLILMLLGVLVLAPSVIAKQNKSAKEALFKELKVFADVITIVQRDYVKEVNPKVLVEGAIKGMLNELDPHSAYMNPDFYKDLRVETKGEFGGLGIEITVRNGFVVVVAPMEGTPAYKAGVRAGDIIVKINGKIIKDLSLLDVVKKLRGKKGTSVTISVKREGVPELLNFTIVRDVIKIKSVKSRLLLGNLGYIRVTQFAENTANDIKKALKKLEKESQEGELEGIILDLRDNPGGLLTQAVATADIFLKKGTIVYTDGRVPTQHQTYFANDDGTEPNYPIVVLINEGSASASEIVSAALQEHGRALLLGRKTFGKGSVQTVTPLENGGALSLTTALYYTASGRSIQAKGVEPDIEMPLPKPQRLAKGEKTTIRIREQDLPGAIENPLDSEQKKEKKKINPSTKEIVKEFQPPYRLPIKEWLKKDPYVAKAVEILKTFNKFKKLLKTQTQAA